MIQSSRIQWKRTTTRTTATTLTLPASITTITATNHSPCWREHRWYRFQRFFTTTITDTIHSTTSSNTSPSTTTTTTNNNNTIHPLTNPRPLNTTTTTITTTNTTSSSNSISLHDKLKLLLQQQQQQQSLSSIDDLQQQLSLQWCQTIIQQFSKKQNYGEWCEIMVEQIMIPQQQQQQQKQQQQQQQQQQEVSLLSSTKLKWYHCVLQAWARTNPNHNNNNNNKQQQQQQQDNHPSPLSSSLYEELPYPVNRAYAVIKRMKQRHEQNPIEHPAPDVSIYEAFLYTCAQYPSPPVPNSIVSIAQSIVSDMEQLSSTTTTTQTQKQQRRMAYHHMLSIWSQFAHTNYSAASTAEDSLLQWVQEEQMDPDTSSFNRILQAWCNHATPDRAYEILQWMISWNSKNNNNTNNNTNNSAITTSSSSLFMLQPDIISFTTVIHGYRRIQQPEMAERVFQQALDYFQQQRQQQQEINNSYHSFQKDQTVTKQQWDLTPCLDATMMAWTYSDHPDAVERVQALLRDAYLLSYPVQTTTTTNSLPIVLEPTAATHRICIQTYIQANRIEDATHDLQEMIRSIQPPSTTTRRRRFSHSFSTTTSTSRTNTILSTGAFHMILQGWKDSQRNDAPIHCRTILQQMIQLSTTNDSSSSSMTIRSCAPETSTFVRVLDVYYQHAIQYPNSPQWALEVLEYAEQRRMVNFYIYKVVLQILERYSRPYALIAYQVYQRALQAVQNQRVTKVESCAWHRITMDALLKHNTTEARELALQILLHDFPEQYSIGALELSYHSILRAFANTSRAGTVATTLYHKLKQSQLIEWNTSIRYALIETWIREDQNTNDNIDMQTRMKNKEMICTVWKEMVQSPKMMGPKNEYTDRCIRIWCPPFSSPQLSIQQQKECIIRAVHLLEWYMEQVQQQNKDIPSLELPMKQTLRKVYDACQQYHLYQEGKQIQSLARTCLSQN